MIIILLWQWIRKLTGSYILTVSCYSLCVLLIFSFLCLLWCFFHGFPPPSVAELVKLVVSESGMLESIICEWGLEWCSLSPPVRLTKSLVPWTPLMMARTLSWREYKYNPQISSCTYFTRAHNIKSRLPAYKQYYDDSLWHCTLVEL